MTFRGRPAALHDPRGHAGSSARPKASVVSHSVIARDSDATSFGAARATAGSSLDPIRSTSSEAVDRMLRRSWLTLATAPPSCASRSFWRSEEVRSVWSDLSAVSASRSSVTPAEGWMIRRASSGASA